MLHKHVTANCMNTVKFRTTFFLVLLLNSHSDIVDQNEALSNMNETVTKIRK